MQVGIDMWRFFKSKQDDDTPDRSQKVKLLGRKISIVTVRCGASLVFASIGAGIGAMMFRPTTGQWIGKLTICFSVSITNSNFARSNQIIIFQDALSEMWLDQSF